MQLSLNWLKDYVKIPKKTTPEELAFKLSLHTVEVENILKEGDKFNNVVVGKILEVRKHPNADRLRLAKVNVGDKKLDIVCGASNIEKGQLVPVALVGAILPASSAGGPNRLEIKETEVRGEKSEGMLCAPDELGLGEDHSGILILSKKAKVGQALAEYFGLDDIILEVDNKSLSNRPDLWCHYGIAREISAFLHADLKSLKDIFSSDLSELINEGEKYGILDIKVKVEDEKLCPRYMAVGVSGIKVGESPEWIKKRLNAAGMRSINNIVDITNFVMLELGQPMHAFDFARTCADKNADLRGSKIVVRRAKKGEKIETLDGNERELDEEMLLIANEEKVLAVAGVMGGAESEISPETSSLILESANFEPVSVRKTSGKLGLRTESSMRFEKFLDPNLCETALLRAVGLIKLVCPEARVCTNLADISNFSLNQGPLIFDSAWLTKKVGNKLPSREVIRILASLGFKVEHIVHKLSIIIPTWRATKDISIAEDIVEEIVRIYGYDNISSTLPKADMTAPEINEDRMLERKIKNILTGTPALTETYNYSFVGEDLLKKMNLDSDSYIRLANPIASNLNLMRQSLIQNLILNIRTNQAKNEEIRLFEIGSIFMSAPGSINKNSSKTDFLPYQEKRVGIVLAGGTQVDLFGDIKGIVEHLLSNLNLPVYFCEKENKPVWSDKKICAGIMAENIQVGVTAKLDNEIGRKLGLKKDVVAAEINFKELYDLVRMKSKEAYVPLHKFPEATRDLAFVIDAKILYNDIKNEIVNSNHLINEVELFDIYQDEKIGKGNKSLAFHITYQADRTLTSEEIDKMQNDLIRLLEEKFEAKVRNF